MDVKYARNAFTNSLDSTLNGIADYCLNNPHLLHFFLEENCIHRLTERLHNHNCI